MGNCISDYLSQVRYHNAIFTLHELYRAKVSDERELVVYDTICKNLLDGSCTSVTAQLMISHGKIDKCIPDETIVQLLPENNNWSFVIKSTATNNVYVIYYIDKIATTKYSQLKFIDRDMLDKIINNYTLAYYDVNTLPYANRCHLCGQPIDEKFDWIDRCGANMKPGISDNYFTSYGYCPKCQKNTYFISGNEPSAYVDSNEEESIVAGVNNVALFIDGHDKSGFRIVRLPTKEYIAIRFNDNDYQYAVLLSPEQKADIIGHYTDFVDIWPQFNLYDCSKNLLVPIGKHNDLSLCKTPKGQLFLIGFSDANPLLVTEEQVNSGVLDNLRFDFRYSVDQLRLAAKEWNSGFITF